MGRGRKGGARRAPVTPSAPVTPRAPATPRRERQTVIPTFDPAELAKELEDALARPTTPPPFDPSTYARIVDAHVSVAADQRDTPRTMTAVAEIARVHAPDESGTESVDTIGRAMYGSYLASDFPEALVLAERVLERQPDHALAQVVLEKCRERLAPPEPRLEPSSVLRLRTPVERIGLDLDPMSTFVLGHVDGVHDAAKVAELSGIPSAEAIDRLAQLVDLGVLEVV